MSACETCGTERLDPDGHRQFRLDGRLKCEECFEVERRLPSYLARKAAHEALTMTNAERLRAWVASWPKMPPMVTGLHHHGESRRAAHDVAQRLDTTLAAFRRLVEGAADLLQKHEDGAEKVQ